MADPMTEDEEWREWHNSQVEQNQASLNSSVDSFDKSMLTLSSGALAVSLAFIKDIVPLGQAHGICLLLISWLSFSACIVITVFSFRFSISALNTHRDFLDKCLEERKRLEDPPPSRALMWCTKWVGYFFVFGLLCTLLFVGINVLHSHSIDGKAQNSTFRDVQNIYMTDQDKGTDNVPQKIVKPDDLQRGRQPMKTKPTPTPAKKD